jgi:hypothetical protein
MKLIVNPKTKQQERKVKNFLEGHSIDYIKLEEEATVYETRKTTPKKPITKKERTKDKLIEEITEAINEVRLIRSGKKKARNAEEFLNEL